MKPSLVLYTHTDVIDVWKPFFGQTKKYMDDFKKIIFVNKNHDEIPSDYEVILYNDSLNYRERLLHCLKNIEDEYFIFHHEDMFLYDKPDMDRLLTYTKYLESTDEMSFIKLIRGGVDVGYPDVTHYPLKRIEKNFEYIFAIQPCIWKRSRLIKMIENSNGFDIWDFEVKAQDSCRKNDILGWYVDDGGVQRGRYHWDSKVYPYVATAVVKGKWNDEYLLELNELFSEYNINPEVRGWKNK